MRSNKFGLVTGVILLLVLSSVASAQFATLSGHVDSNSTDYQSFTSPGTGHVSYSIDGGNNLTADVPDTVCQGQSYGFGVHGAGEEDGYGDYTITLYFSDDSSVDCEEEESGPSPPTSTITPSSLTITIHQSTVISVAANDPSNNLEYINVERLSQSGGFYGVLDSGDADNPDYAGAWSVGTAIVNATRNLTLVFNNAGTYVFRGMVWAGGAGWYYSDNSATIVVIEPLPPSGLVSPSQTSSAINLNWTAPASGSTPQAYDIYRVRAGVTNLIGSNAPSQLSFVDTHFLPGTSYSYFVKTRDAQGNISAASNTITVVTNAVADTNTNGIPDALDALFGNTNPTSDNAIGLKTHRP